MVERKRPGRPLLPASNDKSKQQHREKARECQRRKYENIQYKKYQKKASLMTIEKMRYILKKFKQKYKQEYERYDNDYEQKRGHLRNVEEKEREVKIQEHKHEHKEREVKIQEQPRGKKRVLRIDIPVEKKKEPSRKRIRRIDDLEELEEKTRPKKVRFEKKEKKEIEKKESSEESWRRKGILERKKIEKILQNMSRNQKRKICINHISGYSNLKEPQLNDLLLSDKNIGITFRFLHENKLFKE